MARVADCFYAGHAGLKCENCTLYDQQFCGNYTHRSPYSRPPHEPASRPVEMKVRSGSKLQKIISALEEMGLKKIQ